MIQLQDERIVSYGHELVINVWDISLFKCIKTIKTHSGYVTALIELQDGRLVSAGNDFSIKVWDNSTFECLTTIKIAHCVSNLYQLRDSRLAFSDNFSGIQILNGSTFKYATSIQPSFNSNLSFIQSQDGTLISLSSETDKFCLVGDFCSYCEKRNKSYIQKWDISYSTI